MVITKRIHKINAPSHPLHNENYMQGRIGFWAIVKEVNSLNNTVTVISDTGFEYPNIQVMSSEWITVNDKKNYIPSERNLPPVNSRVFVLTPTFTAVGAFILCSGFSRGDENIRTLWAADENELEEKNNSREKITQGGWDIKEEYANGNFSAESNDGDIKFNVNTTEDSEKEQPKEVSVTAWENNVTINEDGISVTDLNGNTVAATEDGISVTDSNGNTIELKLDSVTNKNTFSVTVGSDNDRSTLVMSGNKVTINGHLEVTA